MEKKLIEYSRAFLEQEKISTLVIHNINTIDKNYIDAIVVFVDKGKPLFYHKFLNNDDFIKNCMEIRVQRGEIEKNKKIEEIILGYNQDEIKVYDQNKKEAIILSIENKQIVAKNFKNYDNSGIFVDPDFEL